MILGTSHDNWVFIQHLLKQHLSIDSDRDDSNCVADAVAAFAKQSSQSILICWEHGELTDIVEALGVKKKNAPDYPDDR